MSMKVKLVSAMRTWHDFVIRERERELKTMKKRKLMKRIVNGLLKSQVNNAFIAWYREVARIAKLIDEKERGFVFAMSTGLKVRILIEDRVCAVPIAVIV